MFILNVVNPLWLLNIWNTVIITALMSSSTKSTINIISGLVLPADFLFVCFTPYGLYKHSWKFFIGCQILRIYLSRC